jgi:2'-5' RNA ligase
MRTFIAVPLPDDCRKALESMQAGMRAFQADVRWTAINSIHLTLKFLGEIDPVILPRLATSLRAETHGPPFTLRIGGLGGFPNLRNPRVIWAGIHGDTERLGLLQSEVDHACAGIDFPKEDRPFQPHLTLGRVQGRRNLQPLLDYIKIGAAAECEFQVDRFNVYESTLTPRGAIYRVLDKLELT